MKETAVAFGTQRHEFLTEEKARKTSAPNTPDNNGRALLPILNRIPTDLAPIGVNWCQASLHRIHNGSLELQDSLV